MHDDDFRRTVQGWTSPMAHTFVQCTILSSCGFLHLIILSSKS
jgi:hypothetical protein